MLRQSCLILLSITLGLILPLGVAPQVRAVLPLWVEPRALSIVDLAGQVPDDVLRDNIAVSSHPAGLARFVSSSMDGDLLHITFRIDTRLIGGQTLIPLLGQLAFFDHMGSVAPPSWLRVYEAGRDITEQALWMRYFEPDLDLPLRGAGDPNPRYEPYVVNYQAPGARVIEEHGLRLPGNYGGELGYPGNHPVLTGVFTVRVTNQPRVTYLGEQRADYASYIGVGYVGWFTPLMKKLHSRYGDRHGRIMLTKPLDANYALFTYPPMPFDAYNGYDSDPSRRDTANLQRPTAGTVRLAPDVANLSADLFHGGAFPLNAAWLDADLSKGPYLSLLPYVDRLAPPELVLPAGIAWDPCFIADPCNCSDAKLKEIYNATMQMRIIYFKVEPASGAGLVAVPLRMADDSWTPSLESTAPSTAVSAVPGQHRVHLPLVTKPAPPPVPIAQGCPCGFFDLATGRMVGYTSN